MNVSVKAGLALIVGSLVVFLCLKFIAILLPVVAILGFGLVVYGATAGRKTLGDGRRRLP